MEDLTIIELNKTLVPEIVSLTCHLNPNLSMDLLISRQTEMFAYENHRCLGLYLKKELIGVSSGWITTRLYSGKQLEIDNFIINPEIQSRGYGAYFLSAIEKWALQNNCLTLELNTYISNKRSHSFYLKLGYLKLGYHFLKRLS